MGQQKWMSKTARFRSVWALLIFISLISGYIVLRSTGNFLYYIVVVSIVFSLLYTLFLAGPFYYKYKKPDKYSGFWKKIGEWYGEK
ncbi:hypothetical protein GCM10010965_23340 [Caldalkalibacillus thermarum]|nr:hypothetical protein GCM10010965_23340 [Caldalkalibacillus thermarum]